MQSDRDVCCHRVVARWRLEHAPCFVRSAEFDSRVSLEPDEVVDGIDEEIVSRSTSVDIEQQSYDASQHRWTYQGGSEPYTIKVEARPPGGKAGDVEVDQCDVFLSCSCPYWVYQGPEYHAQQDDYLLGDPRGTASEPDERDPDRTHRLCKHAYAVLEDVRDETIEV